MRLLFLFIFSLILAACGTTEESHIYIPPATTGGRMCVNQCELAKGFCGESCDLKYRDCIQGVQAQALRDYDQYTREQFAHNQEMDLYLSDFERTQPCTAARNACYQDCGNTYGLCYGNCGGQVVTTDSCQFLCF